MEKSGSGKSRASALADRVVYKVKLDALGHFLIEGRRGSERFETGVRGLPHWVKNGQVLPMHQFHVDPLQRHVEIDDVVYPCDAEGAHRLEEVLNAHFAPRVDAHAAGPIEVRENLASPSGFDLRFSFVHSGVRFEVKGHLDQERLDILQDPIRCGLLMRGTVIRMSAPLLLIRRRTKNGGEEPLVGLPDILYLRATAAQVEHALNHPTIRQRGGDEEVEEEQDDSLGFEAVRLVRVPEDHRLLWMDCVHQDGKVVRRAFTHHNVAALNSEKAFREGVDVSVSLDHRVLSVLDETSGEERHVTVTVESGEAELARASELLQGALHPVERVERVERVDDGERRADDEGRRSEVGGRVTEVGRRRAEEGGLGGVTAGEGGPATEDSEGGAGVDAGMLRMAREVEESAGAEPGAWGSEVREGLSDVGQADRERDDPAGAEMGGETEGAWGGPASEAVEAVEALFVEPADESAFNEACFVAMTAALGLPVQDVELRLERVFEGRRFQVLSFDGQQIEGVMDLRSGTFNGFYLSHVRPGNVLMVYARDGRHIEWGKGRCEVQELAREDPAEFPGNGLVGLAFTPTGSPVFIVTPEYRAWVERRLGVFAAAGARCVTAAEYRRLEEETVLVWPEPGAEC